MVRRRLALAPGVLALVLLLTPVTLATSPAEAPGQVPAPGQFFGFRIGTDNKLARWDRIVEYFKQVDLASDRVQVRELGRTTLDNSFILAEISAPDTLKELDRYKALERKLYFQGGAPTEAERDQIFRMGKTVVLVTCSMHATEVGATQAAIELVHKLATDDSPAVRKILDRVIVLLVPSLNPDGQIMVADWFNKNVGTPFEASAMPWLYQTYVGHDNNRDMYMFTQKESQIAARLLWHEWFPAVWLDEHQMGNQGARIFVMPATDPINANVHPLIYRWNGILGQAQAASLEEAGKEGIIYNATYTNYWQGAMAWTGWWHNQVGLLTEVASVRVAAPVDQLKAVPGQPAAPPPAGERRPGADASGPLPAPRDVNARTEYPRPWLGGRWTLRDIVDYDFIATMGLLEAAADERDALLRQIYEVNRSTIEQFRKIGPAAIVIPSASQHDPMAASRLVEILRTGGVEVERADAPFEADGKPYAAGTFVVKLDQVFGRWAKDLLEKQTYPEVRRSPTSPPEAPYDVTAWSLGMQMGVETAFVGKPIADGVKLSRVTGSTRPVGTVAGNGPRFSFPFTGGDSAIAVNRLLKSGAKVAFGQERQSASVIVSGVPRARLEALATELGLSVTSVPAARAGQPDGGSPVKAPRVGLYQPWTASMDEGWTRWVLEQYQFGPVTLHNDDIKAGKLRAKVDVLVIADQAPRGILEGQSGASARPEYKGGIGDDGLEAIRVFVREGERSCSWAQRATSPSRNGRFPSAT